MTRKVPRVAFFPDSFYEVNGVAHTSRNFEKFAAERDLPFLCIRAGARVQHLERRGLLWSLELPRSAFSIPLEQDLRFDPTYMRHVPLVDEVMEEFAPDIVHITGPSDVGLLGAAFARHYGIPLAASWHTNVHEYAARRFSHLLRAFPQVAPMGAARGIEECTMTIAAHFYSAAQVLYAPNPELCRQLADAAGKPCILMRRGVDCSLFNPEKRTRRKNDGTPVLGFVGRLSVEKNVRLLVQIQRELEQAGFNNFRFVIVGHGSEESWLRRNLRRAEFSGVLKGEALAAAYADMDIFVFPSHTDTFGNVVLEALASGVPAIVTQDGGPASIVENGKTGRVAPDREFASAISAVLDDVPLHHRMKVAARSYATSATWHSVFEEVYRGYRSLLGEPLEFSTADFRNCLVGNNCET